MMVSNIHENLFKRVIERPGLFADAFCNTHRFKSTYISEDIANEIENTIKYLTKSSTIKNYSTQMGSILFALADLSCIPASKKLRILSVLLKEAAESMTCCEQIAQELPAHIQTKTLLNLASNFIREWGEKPCKTRSHFKICKFCDSISNDRTRQYAEKFCCVEAEHFNRLLKEWLSHMSHNTSELKSAEDKYKMNYSSKNTLQKNDFTRIVHNINNAEQLISASENGTTTLEDHYKIGSQSKTYSNISTKLHEKRLRNPNTSEEIESRKAKRLIQSAIEMGHHTGTANDQSEANSNHSPRREKTILPVGGTRSEDHTRNIDAKTGRIREKRDNNSYQHRLGEVEDRDRQDRRSTQRDVQEETNRSWIVAGKTRKDGDAENGNTVREKSGNSGKNPYQHRRGEERETRLLDNGTKKIGRLDRVEEKSASIETSKPTKRPEVKQDGNDRNRHENEENPTTRQDRKKEGEDKDKKERTMLLNKNKEPGSKKGMISFDDAEEERFAVNEEGKLSTNDEQSKTASTEKRYNLEEARKWKVNKPSNPIEYQLSNAHFVELGWTLLPVTKIMRKIVQYEARPAKPRLDWFKKYKQKGMEYYEDGLTPFLKFHPDGSSELFYPNGILAIRVYKPKNRKYDMYTVFTPGGKDALGIRRESQILAIFDTMGYGVVFDMDGAARLSYNQIGGIFTDNPAGLPLVWTWNAKPRESILETVYTERPIDWLQVEFFSATNKSTNSGNVKTPISSSRNKEKKVIEVQKPVVEERQEEIGNKSNSNQDFLEEDICHIKTICMKLNEFLSLRIIDRQNISLQFSARNRKIRIELGTIVNFNKEKASCMIEASDWKSDMLRCRFQENLSKTLEADNSLYDLAKEYRKVKRFAKQRKVMIAKYKPFSKLNRIFTRCKIKN